MSIGLVGVALSLFLGVALGGVSGYYGGFMDTVIQRIIEVVRSVPTIPLWMGLAASLPRDWSILKIYFAITIHHISVRVDGVGASGARTLPGAERRGFRRRR